MAKVNYEVINTVEDAVRLTGISLPYGIESMAPDIQAFIKLRIVVAAYNGLTRTTLNTFPHVSSGSDFWGFHVCFHYIDSNLYSQASEEVKSKYRAAPSGYNGYGRCYALFDAETVVSPLVFSDGQAAERCADVFFDLFFQLNIRKAVLA